MERSHGKEAIKASKWDLAHNVLPKPGLYCYCYNPDYCKTHLRTSTLKSPISSWGVYRSEKERKRIGWAFRGEMPVHME